MKVKMLSLFAAALFGFCGNLAAAQSFPSLSIAQTNENGFYKCGDEVVFTVSAKKGAELWRTGKLRLKLRQDLTSDICAREADLSQENPASISCKVVKPGFITLSAEYVDGNEVHHYWTVCGAGAEPEKLRAGAPVPPDLLTFWRGEYEKFKKNVPAKFEVKEMKPSPLFKRSLITTDMGGGKHFYATLAIPKSYNGSKALPLMITVLPAGNWGHACWEYPGFIRMTISVFTREFKDKKEYSPSYRYQGADKGRTDYFYYDTILGAMRMVDFAKTLPQWDGKNMIAVGQSQGGGLSLILTALCPEITAVAADVPSLCDHHGELAGRMAGGPQLLKRCPGFSKHAGYYDAANFAAFIKCPVIMSAGLIDTVCPAGSIYCAYNNLKCEKQIFSDPLTGHGTGRKKIMFSMMPLDAFLKAQIAKQK